MSLATSLIALGIQPITATRLGYADRVPLDGNGTTQGSATLILPDNTNIAAGTQVGDTAFILPAEAELFLPYFVLNSTAEPALIYPPVGDTINDEAINAAVPITVDTAQIFYRVEEGRWVTFGSVGATGSGTVTSVGMTVPTGLTVAGSPITTSGTFAVTYATGYQGFTTTQAGLIASALQPSAIGSTVQAFSTNLNTWATLAPSANAQSFVTAADYAAMRTLLSLGTAALKNTGTTGNNVPLLDGANTFSAAQTITVTSPGGFSVTCTDSGTLGPIIDFRHNSASPAVNDEIGLFRWFANDTGGNNTEYAAISAVATNVTDTTEAATLTLRTKVAGSDAGQLIMGNGVQVGTGPGGAPGTGHLGVQYSLATAAPVTKTGTSSTVAATEVSVIYNASGTHTTTLPAAGSFTGRWLYLKTIAAQAVNSASSNVVPLGTATAGTAILTANAGRWAFLQSNGTNWVIMAGVV